MAAINPDKQVLYNMVEREVHNLIVNFPILGMFEGPIINYVLNYIDPYVNAFIEGPYQRLDIEQLSSFTEAEVSNKIASFKEKYNKEAAGANHEN